MEFFPPENTEQTAKTVKELKVEHKRAGTLDNLADDKKRQAAEVIYLDRYE